MPVLLPHFFSDIPNAFFSIAPSRDLSSDMLSDQSVSVIGLTDVYYSFVSWAWSLPNIQINSEIEIEIEAKMIQSYQKEN